MLKEVMQETPLEPPHCGLLLMMQPTNAKDTPDGAADGADSAGANGTVGIVCAAGEAPPISSRGNVSKARASDRRVANRAAKGSAPSSGNHLSALHLSSSRRWRRACMYGFSVTESSRQRPSPSRRREAADESGVGGLRDGRDGGMAPNLRSSWPAKSPMSVLLKKPLRANSALPPASCSNSRRSTPKLMGKPCSCSAKKHSRNSSKLATRCPLTSTI
mmetsp:Transcript_77571/g.179848  ORF Transcript_77571/g.179848 Transcript_77571/m.179848 type:complete len:218 (-) Transcript_77571:385-1038(-)